MADHDPDPLPSQEVERDNPTTGAPSARVRVTFPVALSVVAAYSVVFVGGAALSGYSYDDLFSTTRSTVVGAVLPLTAGAVLLVLFLRWSRWDFVFADSRRLANRRSWYVQPAIMVAIVVASLLGTRWTALTAAHILAILAAGALVGFTEETLFRGIVLRSLRTGRRSEAAALGWTTLAFGLFHLTNLLLGEAGAPLQVVFAALTGVGLYLARRLTGLLVASMALHGSWDIASFVHGPFPSGNAADAVAAFLIAVVYVVAALTLVSLLVRERRTPGATAASAPLA